MNRHGRSRYFKYSARVVHSMSNLMSSCSATTCFFSRSFSGPMDQPSPMICVVTPDESPLRTAVSYQRLCGPREHIDEAGGDGEAICVQNATGACTTQVADGDNSITFYRDIGSPRSATSSVINSAAFDKDIKISGLTVRLPEGCQGHRQRSNKRDIYAGSYDRRN